MSVSKHLTDLEARFRTAWQKGLAQHGVAFPTNRHRWALMYLFESMPECDRHKDGRHFTDMNEEAFSALLDECLSLRQAETCRSEDPRPIEKKTFGSIPC